MTTNRDTNPQIYTSQSVTITSTPTLIKKLVWTSIVADGHLLALSDGEGGTSLFHVKGKTANDPMIVLENYLATKLFIEDLDSGRIEVDVA